MTLLDAIYVVAFVGIYIVVLLVGALYLEGIEARRESERRNPRARSRRL
jgi:hypothetical protein